MSCCGESNNNIYAIALISTSSRKKNLFITRHKRRFESGLLWNSVNWSPFDWLDYLNLIQFTLQIKGISYKPLDDAGI